VVTAALPLLPVVTPDEDELDALGLGLAVAAVVAELSEPVLLVALEPAVLAVADDEVLPAYDAAATTLAPSSATVAPAAAPKVSRRRRPRARSLSDGVNVLFIGTW
jgi:hypothetical protein